MTYATESAKFGRIPTVFVELDMDFCSRRSGVGACTATETGDDKCYNTYSTCNDTAKFNKITKTYVFSEQNADLPIGLSTIPLLKSVQFASQEITPGKGLGVRGSVTAKFLDAPFPDTEIDPYWRDRTYDTTNTGTFWGKFKARNPYYENRVLRVRRGYLTAVFSYGNFVDSVYIIDKLDGISKNDDVTIVAKDILKLADDKKALFPTPSTGQLSADISNSATSITLKPTGIGSTYAASGKVAVSGEVMSFTRSGDVLTVTRAQSNTTAAAHTTGDTVQQVGIYTNQKIHYVINDLLDVYAGIDSAYIPYADWVTESTTYLAGVWSAEITEPTGINTLLGELTEQGLCRIWWDELDQEIKFRAVKPLPSGLSTLTDSSNFLTKSIDVKTDTSQRLATILIYFAQKKPTEKLDDLKNYELRVATSDTDASSALKYGTNPIKKIFSRWFKKTSLGRANALSDSLLKTNLNPPRIIEFNLTPSLQLKVGDLFYANTRKIQGLTGANIDVPMEVVYAQPTDKDDIKYKAQEVSTAIPLSNTYTIYISDDEDVNLYDYFVNEFGIPDEGITVNFIVLAGSLVTASASNYSYVSRLDSLGNPVFSYMSQNYGLINPSSWPSGVTLNLTIESGALVGGIGGDGGWVYDVANNDGTGQHGSHGVKIEHAININNQGVMFGGGGGGGSVEYFGAAGGGGAPIGAGGTSGGSSATNTAGGNGGYSPDLGGMNGGNGGGLAANGQDGVFGGIGVIKNLGGIAGDCIHGNSYITWIATGTRHGTIV